MSTHTECLSRELLSDGENNVIQSSAVPSSGPVPGSRDVPSCRYGSVPTRRYIPTTEYAKKMLYFFQFLTRRCEESHRQ